MLSFLQNVLYYMMVEVLEPNWVKLEEALRHQCTTVDEVLKAHMECLDNTIRQCLLSSQSTLKLLFKLLRMCTIFSNQVKQQVIKFTQIRDRMELHSDAGSIGKREKQARLAERIAAELNGQAATEGLMELGQEFDGHLRNFLHELHGPKSKVNLLSLKNRIDYNGYYQDQFSHTSSRFPFHLGWPLV
eukprot:TRINITY_DN1211_c0_g1_i1.p1 TRINITY_DN1211_c0_g1~~TRINITY_DN1211_c0_g1_i1.p1  ORF type:complete len:188 (+),score=38.41 TRINITY_DN1211_c0_g1_i1:232-795(+)